MTWQKLPRGCFTGIDWSRKGALDGWDPYLVWAETDNFAGYRNASPKRLPIAFELKAGTTLAQLLGAAPAGSLWVPDAYLQRTPAPRFATGRAAPAFFQAVDNGRLAQLVERIELGLPAAQYTDEPQATPPGSSRAARAGTQAKSSQASGPAQVQGDVVAIIDDSLALANAAFLANRKSRTQYFWRQDEAGRGTVPDGFGYGHEQSAADIDKVIGANIFNGLVDEGRVYTQLGLSTLGDKHPSGELRFHTLDTPVSHGSHVADLAAGPYALASRIAGVPPHYGAPPSWALANDAASRAALVAVQLDYDTVKDTSGGSLNVHVLDGLMYVLRRCAPTARISANISFGTIAGPHDGTSVLEQAMAALCAEEGARLAVTLAAGNSYQQRTHANVTLAAGDRCVLHWQVQPDDITQSFVELWIQDGCKDVEIVVTPPGGTALPAMRIGEGGVWTGSGTVPLATLIYPQRAATGKLGTCALLALAPTHSFDSGAGLAPSGRWDIELVNRGKQDATIDAYVERDDVAVGTRAGARQSHFEDALYDTSGNPGSFIDHPSNPTLIRRSGNFNSIATGHGVRSAGGTRVGLPAADPEYWAHYSPREPDPDASRPQRPQVRKVPSAQAPSDENAQLPGVNAAGSRSGALVRMVGTSAASPQVARMWINGQPLPPVQ
ncbi:hypothetical protein [Ramlibacter albus]|uniref:Peptidase S8/S53 domain-containing protein n=1 Tax=Ramlibacter albus TaxID=2079448 RepID=A0A923M5V2_9BURK|nr:hypothetical protein [Ramlibacter albus]MBC5763374.1 hypothetical protein [Ramlibacter albus]